MDIFLLLFILGAYFLPWLVASSRRHQNSGAIAMLNLLLGWTLLGWIVAMVWACTRVDPTAAKRPASRLFEPLPEDLPRKCPFCAETIQAEAIKCKHCGSDLSAQQAS